MRTRGRAARRFRRARGSAQVAPVEEVTHRRREMGCRKHPASRVALIPTLEVAQMGDSRGDIRGRIASGGAPPPQPDRTAPRAVLHVTPRASRGRRGRARRAARSISAAAIPTSRRRRTSSTPSSNPRASRRRRARIRALRGPARAPRGDRRALRERLRRGARSAPGGRRRPGHEDRAGRGRALCRRTRRRDRTARPRLPGLSVRGRTRRSGARVAAARRSGAARVGRPHEEAGARLPQLPVESDRGGGARRRLRRGRRPRRLDGRSRPARLRVRRSRLRRPPAARAFSPSPARARSGVELFSLSKSYGMAGWRLGFVLGNEELVARVTWLQEHVRAGIFVALQRAAIAALTGPQETVAERRALYEARRDRVVAALRALSPRCEGTFFVWLELPDGLVLRAAAPGGSGRARTRRRLRGARARPGAALPRRLGRDARRRPRPASAGAHARVRSSRVRGTAAALGRRARRRALRRVDRHLDARLHPFDSPWPRHGRNEDEDVR